VQSHCFELPTSTEVQLSAQARLCHNRLDILRSYSRSKLMELTWSPSPHGISSSTPLTSTRTFIAGAKGADTTKPLRNSYIESDSLLVILAFDFDGMQGSLASVCLLLLLQLLLVPAASSLICRNLLGQGLALQSAPAAAATCSMLASNAASTAEAYTGTNPKVRCAALCSVAIS
jgi:hypothetical protein